MAWLDFGFILVNTSTVVPDAQFESRLLCDSILSGLRETGLFQDVDSTNSAKVGSGIRISASISRIMRVSKNSREWFGGLAGNAVVVVHVTVSDLATGAPVEAFDVEGDTGAKAWSGPTDVAVQQAAQRVVAEITSLDSKAAGELMGIKGR